MKFEVGKTYKIVNKGVVGDFKLANTRGGFKVGDIFTVDGTNLIINSSGGVTTEDLGWQVYFARADLLNGNIIEVPQHTLMTLEEIKNSDEVFVVESAIGASSILHKCKMTHFNSMVNVVECTFGDPFVYKIYKFDDYPKGKPVYVAGSKQNKILELQKEIDKLKKEIEDEQ